MWKCRTIGIYCPAPDPDLCCCECPDAKDCEHVCYSIPTLCNSSWKEEKGGTNEKDHLPHQASNVADPDQPQERES